MQNTEGRRDGRRRNTGYRRTAGRLRLTTGAACPRVGAITYHHVYIATCIQRGGFAVGRSSVFCILHSAFCLLLAYCCAYRVRCKPLRLLGLRLDEQMVKPEFGVLTGVLNLLRQRPLLCLFALIPSRIASPWRTAEYRIQKRGETATADCGCPAGGLRRWPFFRLLHSEFCIPPSAFRRPHSAVPIGLDSNCAYRRFMPINLMAKKPLMPNGSCLA